MRINPFHINQTSTTMKRGLFLLPLFLLLTGCEPKARETAPEPEQNVLSEFERKLENAERAIEHAPAPKATPLNSMVVIQSTNQEFSQLQPWTKDSPYFERGTAIYLGEGKFLTTANVVSSSNFIELVLPDRSKFAPGVVEVIDEEANLALVSIKNGDKTGFSESLVAMETGDSPALGDDVELWQFNSEGIPLITTGSLQSTNLLAPFTSDSLFTIYDFKSSTAPAISDASIPVVKNGKLTAISLKCNTGSQQVLALPLPVILQFLQAAETGKASYKGFPEIGIQTDFLLDPVFRRYLKLDEQGGGLFISKVIPRSAADKAGIRQGDVLEAIDGIPVDPRGLIKDDKLGPVPYSILLRDTRKQGDTVILDLKRDGKPVQATVKLDRDAIEKDIIFRRPSKAQPDYIIEGGIIFQAMTYPLLEALVDKNSNSRASLEMLEAIDKKEDYVKQGRDEIIIISNVLPTQAALGYSFLPGSVLQKINGVTVKNLKHLAQLLDQPVKDDMIHLETNKPPYVIYISQKAMKQGNTVVQRNGIPVLRHLSR